MVVHEHVRSNEGLLANSHVTPRPKEGSLCDTSQVIPVCHNVHSKTPLPPSPPEAPYPSCRSPWETWTFSSMSSVPAAAMMCLNKALWWKPLEDMQASAEFPQVPLLTARISLRGKEAAVHWGGGWEWRLTFKPFSLQPLKGSRGKSTSHQECLKLCPASPFSDGNPTGPTPPEACPEQGAWHSAFEE